MAQVLVSLTFPPNSKPLLHQLVVDGKLHCIKDVLNQCAKQTKTSKASVIDINQVDADGCTLLVLALKNKHYDIAKYFLKTFNNKLDLNIKNNKASNAITLAYKS